LEIELFANRVLEHFVAAAAVAMANPPAASFVAAELVCYFFYLTWTR
jgi:hypothetical protein